MEAIIQYPCAGAKHDDECPLERFVHFNLPSAGLPELLHIARARQFRLSLASQ